MKKTNLYACLASLLLVGSLHAQQFSNIYFFGDSLTDLGNNTGAGSCNNGVCTNPPGLTWAYFLGQEYQMNISRSKDGGTDYAYSGAVTSGDTGSCMGDPNCTTAYQISNFIQQSGNELDHNALYTLWAGANNLLNTLLDPTPLNIINAATLAANDVSLQVEQLHSAGARNILVSNLPDLSQTPLIAMIGNPLLSQAMKVLGSENFNNQLLSHLAEKDYDVILLDAYSIVNNIINNPGLYGFSNVTSLCDPNVDPSCAGYLFVYNVHPTVAAHEITSDYIYTVLTAPSFYAGLSRMTSQNIMNNLSAIRQQMIPNIKTDANRGLSFFGTLGVQPDSRYEINHFTEINSSPISGTIGLQSFMNDSVSVGIAFTESFATTDNTQQMLGDFHLNSSMLSLFLSYFKPSYYIDGILSAGIAQYHDINRYIKLGPYNTQAHGSTSGTFLSGSFEGGWFPWKNETMQLGPYAGVDINQVGLDSYTEQGAPTGVNLYFNAQDEDTLTGKLGIRLRWFKEYEQSLFVTNINLAVLDQWLDETRQIRFHVASLAGSHGSLPIAIPKGVFGQVGINIANIRSSGVVWSGGYQYNAGEDHYQAHVINLAVSLPMDKA
jgi:outer membrane lipase/esterase